MINIAQKLKMYTASSRYIAFLRIYYISVKVLNDFLILNEIKESIGFTIMFVVFLFCLKSLFWTVDFVNKLRSPRFLIMNWYDDGKTYLTFGTRNYGYVCPNMFQTTLNTHIV